MYLGQNYLSINVHEISDFISIFVQLTVNIIQSLYTITQFVLQNIFYNSIRLTYFQVIFLKQNLFIFSLRSHKNDD